MFDPANEEWIEGPEIPVDRRRGSSGLVIFNDKFYVIAGNTDGHDGGFIPWFDEYDPATGIWTTLTDAPNARDHFHATVIGNALYVAGGRLSGGTGGVFGPTIDEVDVYDFNTNTWSTLPSVQNIPTSRGGASSVNFNDKLLVIGGEVMNEDVYGVNTDDALSITEEYDPVTQSWRRLADLNFERHGTQAIVSGGGIFILGGSPDRGGGNQRNLEFFGANTPTGVPSISSGLNAPTAVEIADGNSEDINLDVVDGNVGIYIRSIEISGPDATDFTITAGELANALLNPLANHIITVTSAPSDGANRNATLNINYGVAQSLVINLANFNEDPIVTNPGNQFNVENDVISLQIETIDAGNVTYSAAGLPPDLTIDPVSGLISGTITDGGVASNAFNEENGVVVVEAESTTLTSNWTSSTLGGADGIMGGTNSFATQNGGTISYDINITTPGVYRFNWRSLFTGASPTDENDSWLRFPNNDDVWFFGIDQTAGDPGTEADIIALLLANNTSDLVFPGGSGREGGGFTSILDGSNNVIDDDQGSVPHGQSTNGYFKTFRSGGTSQVYDWQARTSDFDSHDIYVWFVNPGIYTVDISERSAGHTIDRFALYKVDGPDFTDAQLTALPESSVGNGAEGAAANSPYNVEITVEDDGTPPGSSTIQFTWVIGEVGDLIAVPEATPLSGEVPLLVNFTGSNSLDDVGVETYFWDFKDGTTSTEADPTHTFTVVGSYLVELTVTDIDGNSSTNSITITVNPAGNNEAPVAIADATPSEGDAPLEVSFTGNGSTDDVAIVSYLWDFQDGTTSNEVDPTHIFTVVGVYDVTLTVTDGEGLTNTATIQITVNAPNQGPVAIATATPLIGSAPLEVNFHRRCCCNLLFMGFYGWQYGYNSGSCTYFCNSRSL